MPKYKIVVERGWIETGTVVVEADSEDEARDMADHIDDFNPYWTMEPEYDNVESVEEVEDET